jgi:5'-deoxynucleotidase YfbR-like HD superfamily hydrolase
MNSLTTVTLLRDAADVRRYHTRRVLREQTLGQHSFNVMMLIQHLDPWCRKELLLAAMHHDLPEYFTGDVPAPIKRMQPALAIALEQAEADLAPLFKDFNLSVYESRLLKFCDTLELVFWCLEEVDLGNTSNAVSEPLTNGLRWCFEYIGGLQGAPTVLKARELLWDVQGKAREFGVIVEEE